MPLQEFLNAQVYLYLLCFVRVGTALTIMPGVGDGFVPMRLRLFFSLGLTAVVFPVLYNYLPQEVPTMSRFLTLIFAEFLIGLFIGMMGRILAMALDTAGMIISMQSGLASAQMFNPAMQGQGSLFGVFLTLSGILLMFVTDMHHMLLAGLYNSYEAFPVGNYLATGAMLDIVSRAVGQAFLVGFQMATPFLLVITVLYVAMGVLSRLMPNIHVFMIAMPAQILLAFVIMSAVIGAGLLFWLSWFQQAIDLYYQVGSGG